MVELHDHDVLSGRDPLTHDGNRLETLIQINELLLLLGALSQTTIMRQQREGEKGGLGILPGTLNDCVFRRGSGKANRIAVDETAFQDREQAFQVLRREEGVP